VRLTRRPTLIGDVGSIQLIGHGRIVGNSETILPKRRSKLDVEVRETGF
jgi:hypothetical protein